MSNFNIELGRRLRMYRQKRKISQEQLGNMLGISFQQIQKYENGQNRLFAERAAIIAEILSVSLIDLIPECDCKIATQKLSGDAMEIAMILDSFSPKKRKALLGIARELKEVSGRDR